MNINELAFQVYQKRLEKMKKIKRMKAKQKLLINDVNTVMPEANSNINDTDIEKIDNTIHVDMQSTDVKIEDVVLVTNEDLADKTIVELKEIAKERNIKNWYKLSKVELIESLKNDN